MARSNHLKEIEAVIDASDLSSEMHVLDLGWEGECIGDVLCKESAKVTFVADDVRAVEHLREEGNVVAVLGCDPQEAISEPVDRVIYRPAQRAAKGQVFEWIEGAFEVLQQGGRFIIAGRRDRGIESYARRISEVFGNCELSGRVGKFRVYWARKENKSPLIAPADNALEYTVADMPKGPYRIKARPGVFSFDHLDPGTRLLIEHLDVGQSDRVLDWGCGWGALGLVSARLAPMGQVLLVDASLRAVKCAQENLVLNEITNATAQVGDARLLEPGDKFDLIVSNPPFHEGNAAGHPLIENGFQWLNAGGCMMLVVMRANPYLKHLEKIFGQASVVAQKGGYSIISAVRGTV